MKQRNSGIHDAEEQVPAPFVSGIQQTEYGSCFRVAEKIGEEIREYIRKTGSQPRPGIDRCGTGCFAADLIAADTLLTDLNRLNRHVF
ncbi:MAG: hypothetical protein ACLR5Q_01635 [Coprococcus sp.]